jgi:hypothetical protein
MIRKVSIAATAAGSPFFSIALILQMTADYAEPLGPVDTATPRNEDAF